MRESLFRAAQLCNYSVMEESVGQLQNLNLIQQLYSNSKTEVILTQNKIFSTYSKKTILWPYPQNTADCIDRANCVDNFVSVNPMYRIITEYTLNDCKSEWLYDLEDNIILFASFEYLFKDVSIEKDNFLYYRGRKCHAVINELSIGYLLRKHILKYENLSELSVYLKTKIINETLITINKVEQMKIIHEVQEKYSCREMDVLEFMCVDEDSQLHAAVKSFLKKGQSVVIRPFSSSQGTGLSFVSVNNIRTDSEKAVNDAINATTRSYNKKYGSKECYPLTITPFIESIKLDRCVTDFRIFVVYDCRDASLHALPGMIRRAQLPFDKNCLSIGNGVTNLNAPKVEGSVEGKRVFAVTDNYLLKTLNVSEKLINSMCTAACQIWKHILDNEFSKHNEVNFAYGSVDFLVKEENNHYVPIEINGANVGSHPAVHPCFLNFFGNATSNALCNLGLGGMNES